MKKLIQKSRLIIVILCAVILSFIPFYIMLIKGIYSWHLSQPEFVQGGAELCIVFFLMYLGWIVNKKRVVVPAIIMSCIYLSVNGVIVPVVSACLYIGIICYVGFSLGFIDRSNHWILKLMKAFIRGIVIWGAGAIVLSMIGIGTINALRIYTVILFVFACIFSAWKNKNLNVGLLIDKTFKYRNNSYIEVALIIIMIAIVLALFAKTNTAQDYDSLWYGLRSEYVLVGNKSFYDDLGYFSYVYFYPKFSELFFLPLSSLGDYSFIPCANILIFVMAIMMIYHSLQKNIYGIDKKTKIILVTTIESIPAFANISATAKPDILGFYLVLCAFSFMQEYIENDDYNSIIYALVSLGMCTAVKLTYILWGGILFIWGICVFFVKERRKQRKYIQYIKKEWIIIVASIVTIVGVHYRTFKFTGYIIYPIGISIWNKIFHNEHGYYLTQSNSMNNKLDVRTMISRIYEFIFDPQPLGHVIILWTSNLLLVVLMIWIFYKKRKIKIEYKILAVIYTLCTLYYMISMSNPDGNYFILPIIVNCIIISGGIQSEQHSETNAMRSALTVVLASLLPIMFISHSSWAWGTKVFSKDLIVNNFETREKNLITFNYYGVNSIVEEVKTYSVNEKVISSTAESGLYFRFPCNLETYSELSLPAFSNAGISQYSKFKEIMDYLSVKALIVDKNDTSEFPELVLNYIQEEGVVKIIEDQGAICYVLR